MNSQSPLELDKELEFFTNPQQCQKMMDMSIEECLAKLGELTTANQKLQQKVNLLTVNLIDKSFLQQEEEKAKEIQEELSEKKKKLEEVLKEEKLLKERLQRIAQD